jgi:hypothetical protein
MKRDLSAECLQGMVRYVRSQVAHIHSVPFDQLLRGDLALKDNEDPVPVPVAVPVETKIEHHA